MSAFLFIMVLNTLKFTIQKEKKRIFIFKYCKIDVKSAATLIFAATLITAPTVQYTVYSIQNNHLCQQLFTKFTSKRKAEINKFYTLTYFNSIVDR